MLTQKACFNSPVWFNVGVKEARGYGWVYDQAVGRHRQAGTGRHAAAMLGLLHRLGEGFARIHPRPGQDRGHAVQVGLRHRHATSRRCARKTPSSRAAGAPPGRCRFMKGFDAFAGVIKSGGKTRRAAKMVILNVDHPDIESSSGARPRKRRRPTRWSRRATIRRSTAKPTAPSSSRTPTIPCA